MQHQNDLSRIICAGGDSFAASLLPTSCPNRTPTYVMLSAWPLHARSGTLICDHLLANLQQDMRKAPCHFLRMLGLTNGLRPCHIRSLRHQNMPCTTLVKTCPKPPIRGTKMLALLQDGEACEYEVVSKCPRIIHQGHCSTSSTQSLVPPKNPNRQVSRDNRIIPCPCD